MKNFFAMCLVAFIFSSFQSVYADDNCIVKWWTDEAHCGGWDGYCYPIPCPITCEAFWRYGWTTTFELSRTQQATLEAFNLVIGCCPENYDDLCYQYNYTDDEYWPYGSSLNHAVCQSGTWSYYNAYAAPHWSEVSTASGGWDVFCGEDSDSDGLPNNGDNCPETYNPDQADADKDGIGEACDYCVGAGSYDIDEDGYCEGEDNCPDTFNPDQTDYDDDGNGDACDNCVEVYNLGQEDVDEDTIGNTCDNCPDVSNLSQEDADGDEIGDACDLCPNDYDNDIDLDSICGDVDNCLSIPNPDQEDTYPPQSNGIGDACDCEGDFDCDGDVDGTDATTFKLYFGRSLVFYPCDVINPCRGDFDCDGDSDGTDAVLFKSDFGRSEFLNPCPVCVVGQWCVYP